MFIFAFVFLCVYLKQCTVLFSSCATRFPFEKCFGELRPWPVGLVTSDLSETQLTLWMQIFQICPTLGEAKPLSPPSPKRHRDGTKRESPISSWSGALKDMKDGAEILRRTHRIWGSDAWAPACSLYVFWLVPVLKCLRNTAAGKRYSERKTRQWPCDLRVQTLCGIKGLKYCTFLVWFAMPGLAGLHPTLESSSCHITLTDHFALKVQGYLWFLGFQRAEWEAEPSAITLPFCGTSSQFGFRGQTPSLFSRLGSKRWSRTDRSRKILHRGLFSLGLRAACCCETEDSWLDFHVGRTPGSLGCFIVRGATLEWNHCKGFMRCCLSSMRWGDAARSDNEMPS